MVIELDKRERESDKSPEAMQKNPEFSNSFIWSREPEPFFSDQQCKKNRIQ